MIEYKKLSKNVYSYKNKIHGISQDHPHITVPRRLFENCNLQLGMMVLVEIKFKNKVVSFIGRISKGMHILLIWVPLKIIRDYNIKENIKIDVKIRLNETEKTKLVNNIDLINLDTPKIAKFVIKKYRVLVRHHGSSKRQHKIRRFIEINKELAYIIGLYDAEGAENSFRFTNSDPKLIKTFLDYMKNIFEFDELEFDAQITLVNKNRKSEHAKIFWSKLFPEINIYPKASFKFGEGIENGSLSILINTITMNVLWNTIRGRVRELLIDNNELSSSYIAGVLDGDGNVHKRGSLDIRCTFDAKKGHYHFAKALDKLNVSYQVEEDNDNNRHIVTIRKWNNTIRLFNNNAIFRNNLTRRKKLIEQFLEHRRSKVILRTLRAIDEENLDEKSICDVMGIQRKHIARVRLYLNQLMKHNMISLNNEKFDLKEKGKKFLAYSKMHN